MIKNHYDYKQDKLPFKVYGAILLKIRTRFNLNQKNFSHILNISSVVYNKVEMSLSRGSIEYSKPSIDFYTKFCLWFNNLTPALQNEITLMITTLFDVLEICDPAATPASRHTAVVTQKTSICSFSTQEYTIKTTSPIDNQILNELTSFLDTKGITSLVFQPV